MTNTQTRLNIQSNCLLQFRICKAVFEDEGVYSVSYGIKATDEYGNLRVHIREVSDDFMMVKELVDRLNCQVVSQAHLMDKLYEFVV
ncbi:MAG: hypothetical protein VB100_01240 [Angelakisella sp.]|nr:hypothetical protein [Angelakisella sp.]